MNEERNKLILCFSKSDYFNYVKNGPNAMEISKMLINIIIPATKKIYKSN